MDIIKHTLNSAQNLPSNFKTLVNNQQNAIRYLLCILFTISHQHVSVATAAIFNAMLFLQE
jgi:hypothetical protein